MLENMSENLITASYIIALVLFILSLGGLSNHESAKRAVWYGIVGMGFALLGAIAGLKEGTHILLFPALILGGLVGWQVAKRVEMTQMPQLVAVLHSFVGLAAVFIGINASLDMVAVLSGGNLAELSSFAKKISDKNAVELNILRTEIALGVFIGAVTFTGSVIAWGKLAGKVNGKAIKLPGGHWWNGIALVVSAWLGVQFFMTDDILWLVALSLVAGFIGLHLIMGIGGADMPVVVSMLNSYSGWAAVAIGFSLENDLLIVTGALVGASGAILSYIMSKAMNRQFISVILGGFGNTSGPTQKLEGEQIAIDVDSVASTLNDADSIIIIPGYGMAVAQAQQAVSELTRVLTAKGKTVRFAIHPVAGRLPGHMNVLLAEAKVPYDIVLEMDEINDDFPETDVAIVIGSNDTVNPAAQDDPNSPIAGMPVLQAWNAKTVFVSKRGQGTGYSGIENPLFYKENTRMFYGDAKDTISKLVSVLTVAKP